MESILLIEDDEDLAIGIQYALHQENHKAEIANTIQQAKHQLQTSQYSLIILDVMLPDGNGFEFLKELRKTSKLPVIFLTAKDEEFNVIRGLDIGGDDYITKPFRVKELISRIKAVLRRQVNGTVHSVKALYSGGLKVFPEEHLVFKNDCELVLTAHEFRMLSTFMSHPKLVLTRNIILDALWDIDGVFVDDNTLSVNVKRLRDKIEDDPSKPSFIVTVRGIGYRWNCDVKGE